MMQPINEVEARIARYHWHLPKNRHEAMEEMQGWRLAVQQNLPRQVEHHRSRFTEILSLDECQKCVSTLQSLKINAKPFAVVSDLRLGQTLLIKGDRLDWRVEPVELVTEPIPAKALAARELAESNGYVFDQYWFAAPYVTRTDFSFEPVLTRSTLRLIFATAGRVVREMEKVSVPTPSSIFRLVDPLLLGSRGPVMVELARWL